MDQASHVHTYRSELSWEGSTGVGYEHYERAHRVVVPPADGDLVLSSDPAFLGDARLANPEVLLLAAASSCQLLSFLAIAARSRIDVLAYSDEAEAVMPEDVRPMRIARIVLRPRIVVAEGTPVERVERIVHKAHDECFIANSLNSEMELEAEIQVAGGRRAEPVELDE
jgi:organic hydroperoxide reductase OsmC/OhrA